MKHFFAVAAITMGTFLFATQSQAQDGARVTYDNAYQGGVGFGYGFQERFPVCGIQALVHPRIEQPPHFALFPPVYYNSTIVRRPMGISPFAAPPGIMPAEMRVPQAERVVNPFFKRSPNEAPSETASAKKDPET